MHYNNWNEGVGALGTELNLPMVGLELATCQHDSFDQFIFQSALFSYHSTMTLPCLVVLSHFDTRLALRLVSY